MEEEKKKINYRYPEKRATAILKILHEQTDEVHTIKQTEIKAILEELEMNVHRDTLSKVICQLADELNPSRFIVDSDGTNNDDDFIIKFDGYKNENASDSYVNIKKKSRKIRDEIKRGKSDKIQPQNSPSMTNIYMQHPFSYKELDQLMDAINFSDKLTLEEKRNLMEKVSKTSSQYYETPFYNKDTKKLRYNYNTTNKRFGEDINLIENLKIIQKAINARKKIRFIYNYYDKNNNLNANTIYEVSPYYVVVDNDLYYLISGVTNQKNSMHSRIDLMTNIEMLDEKIDSIQDNFPNIPTREKWNPMKYVGEHIYMGYNKPVEIQIKQKKECGYNRYHDWFGDCYKVSDRNCEEGYEIITVKNSPYMMAFWALQYGEQVEILNEDVREHVRDILDVLNKKYNK